jgi:ketosteroid isomerase-like protein
MVSVREILERQDFDAFTAALAPDVVWVGVLPGQLCRNRDQVVETFRNALDAGVQATPEILAESDEALLVDFHPQPPPELVPALHQIFVLHDEQIVELRDFPDRRSALDAYERMVELEASA